LSARGLRTVPKKGIESLVPPAGLGKLCFPLFLPNPIDCKTQCHNMPANFLWHMQPLAPSHSYRRVRSLADTLADFVSSGKPLGSSKTSCAAQANTLGECPNFYERILDCQTAPGPMPLMRFLPRCFSSQITRFFIERPTQAWRGVYDPFMGRHEPARKLPCSPGPFGEISPLSVC